MRRMKRFGRAGPDGPDDVELELTDGVSGQSIFAPPVSVTSVKDVGRSVAHLASYTRGRWKHAARRTLRKKHTEEYVANKYKGLATDEDAVDGLKNTKIQLNKMLLDHFRVLAASNKDTDEVDLQLLNDVLTDGADPNSADKYGQTALHEISRAWNVDVMRFFLERGADFQRADAFGVTPLHVAAALDYEEMMHFLLERGADIEARTVKDKQTPLHFAAKNDGVGGVRVLLQNGADIAVRDYKERTPLQLAANFDRSETARLLLEFGADAGVQDSDGQLCITAMITKMSPVANQAMNQFLMKDRMARQKFYYLHLLEPKPADKTNPKGSDPSSPLEFIVNEGKLDLIMHPVVLKLITVKWNLYGRRGAWILLLFNFLFIVSWTTVAISVSVRPNGDRYKLPEDWWRVLLVVLALVLTVGAVYREVMEIVRSGRKLKHWQCWTVQKINEDLSCSHPMWPEERNYLEGQIRYIRNLRGTYTQDPWNIFDWLVYLLLLAVLGIHLTDIFLVSATLRQNSLRLFAVSIIFLWLRLMKHVRAFRAMGPFIVMLGKIAGDVLRFLFLYIEIYIPYACAFWIIFGGLAEVPSMETVPELLYSLYRITLVDEYEFDAMLDVDAVMAYLLCGTFLALSAVLCVNLLIALLSDTFQRVYDNALANAVMQQAAIILQIEESMSCLRRFYDNEHIHRHCAPLGEFFDDDVTTNPDQHAEMKKLTEQIKDTLDKYLNIQRETISPQYADARDVTRRRSVAPPEREEHLKTLQRLQKDQQKQSQDLSELKAEVKELHSLLLNLIQPRTNSTSSTHEDKTHSESKQL
ncbi:transient receptor potential channel pyrexia [Pimephales promelas]|uniref:transient receptor potential channel pyrexia n=1 Tax=Pimephales promelas TaxID=90988 RepID=UPI00195570DD|nr:transient receptor potential channel pyrexia [Pimephales promelas]KAG1941629.1 transient receptor potential cation channel subfamily A [Pimephales promelas]